MGIGTSVINQKLDFHFSAVSLLEEILYKLKQNSVLAQQFLQTL